jgi:hypothetical protein
VGNDTRGTNAEMKGDNGESIRKKETYLYSRFRSRATDILFLSSHRCLRESSFATYSEIHERNY